MSDATVVIVNYNGAHLLPDCLDGLARQREEGVCFDTIVVDNASTDASTDLLARDYPWVRVIVNDDNLGFAGGNNVALAVVTTPYAVLLNNDAVPEPLWLRNLLAAFSQPGNEDVGIVTGKILFLPKFVELHLSTPGFRPATSDSRDLGVKIFSVRVDGAAVTDKVIWQDAAYSREGQGEEAFRWSRPTGSFLVPVPGWFGGGRGRSREPTVTVEVAATTTKPVEIGAQEVTRQVTVGATPVPVEITLRPDTPLLDVVNNAGGQVFDDGSGGDRGFQQIDRGQYDEAQEVFTACGNGMAMRTAIGRELGWFDGGFFMYYEDADLSWRWRSAGWTIRYEPSAVLRHVHAASSKEWSPSWMFHVERNRLLMLTKNASRPLATSVARDYARSAVAAIASTGRDVLVHHRRPDLSTVALKLRVLRSYSAKVPRAVRDRIALRRNARVPVAELERWLVRR